MEHHGMAASIPADLPDDTEVCHALIRELVRDIRQYQQRIDDLTRRLFGRRSEKLDPKDLDFFGHPEWLPDGAPEAVADAPDDEAPEETDESEAKMRPAPKRRNRGRKPLPKDLPRDRREYGVPEAEKTCPDCGAEKQRIGEDVTEQLDYVPASLVVVEHVRLKYACKHCQGHVTQAEKPPQPIEKGLAGPGLLAHVITSKYCDHLPLHRQESILARHGVELSRSTLCDWMMDTAALLEPVVRGMQREMLKSAVLHTDDTPVPVQAKGRTHRAYLWVYLGNADHPYTIYDFTWNRSRAGPAAILENYEGYLQADAFSGYNPLYVTGRIVELGCWAHARRKFYEAKESDPVRAHDALRRIGEMYRVEADARDLDAAGRLALRRQRTRPLLESFAQWLEKPGGQVLPKSPLGKAIAYAENHWAALERFTTDGHFSIDNNAAERALRPVCVGRKNWLFAGSERGGHAAAILYSLIESAKRHAGSRGGARASDRGGVAADLP